MSEEPLAEPNLARIEEEVRRHWQLHRVPETVRAARRSELPYIVYQQPLSIAGQSRADQVRLWTAADLLARYYTMRGKRVQHQVGWTCHGLAVEVQVERASAPQGRNVDPEWFAAACRATALEAMGRGEALAEWLGVWMHAGSTYATLEPGVMSTVWGALRRLWDAGRLKDDLAVVPVCPRCDTPLSTAEAGWRCAEAQVRPAWVRVPWDSEPETYFLTWTETPWMLIGMVALAVHPGATYVVVEVPGQPGVSPARLVLAESSVDRALLGGFRPIKQMAGKTLRGTRYRPLFTFLPESESTGCVVLSPDVPLDRGTGVLPVTPAFHAPSLALAQAHNLPIPQLLGAGGNLDDKVMPWRGLSPLDAEPMLIDDLHRRGLLVRQGIGASRRALCPYCQTPLLPLARTAWWIELEGRRWIVGRDRVWGTPLPVWRCGRCGERTCIAGLDDLAHRADLSPDQIDPHRPAVDRITLACPACGGTMHRVPAVLDAAFEAAVLPRAAPPRPEPSAPRAAGGGSVAVAIGGEQGGWLEDVKAIANLLGKAAPWEQVSRLPVADAAPDLSPPPSISGGLPADAWRWAALAGIEPEQAERSALRPLWRLAAGRADQPWLQRKQERGAPALVDRWLRARIAQALNAVTLALDAADPVQAARHLAVLLDDLDWIWPRQPGGDGAAIAALNRMVAPFVPHLAEAIHRQLGAAAQESLHLSGWPSPDPSWADPDLLVQMATVRQLTVLACLAREQAGLAADQPARQAVIARLNGKAEDDEKLAPFRELLASTLGCVQVRFSPDAAAHLDWRLTLNPEKARRRTIPFDAVDAMLTSLDRPAAASIAAQVRNGFSVRVELAGQAITLLPEEVDMALQAPHGWTAAADATYVVLLESSNLPISVS